MDQKIIQVVMFSQMNEKLDVSAAHDYFRPFLDPEKNRNISNLF